VCWSSFLCSLVVGQSKEFTSPAARLTQQLELLSGGWWFDRWARPITNIYNRNQRSDLRSDRDSNAGQAHSPWRISHDQLPRACRWERKANREESF
jgi:hypothetical protein